MIENNAKDIMMKSSDLLKIVREYILSNKNWLYYFINKNDFVFELLSDHRDDWIDYVDLKVENCSGANAYVDITIVDDFGDDKCVFARYVSLPGFEGETLRLYNEYHENAIEKAIKDKRHELEYYESKSEHVRKELEELENKKK